ncbi:hypothetical protein LGM90_10210 [Burkholderia sp. AU28942]|uniref:hypothetical protein n=1 Tax=Burkholderia TaxID=32008 RepID=UPI0012EA25B7|nr:MULTISPECIES: hypothetical protein [Burkholderia]MCA8308881.1 hypothetical protein [Burkholderia sp. AU28942]QTO50879.1 hypothetical protein J8I86_15585 [Burkholderia latens]
MGSLREMTGGRLYFKNTVYGMYCENTNQRLYITKTKDSLSGRGERSMDGYASHHAISIKSLLVRPSGPRCGSTTMHLLRKQKGAASSGAPRSPDAQQMNEAGRFQRARGSILRTSSVVTTRGERLARADHLDAESNANADERRWLSRKDT